MTKIFHEIRDPIHVFVHLDTHDRKVIDSRPFQRLRHINQLALTYLIYPGATHKRFEHSLGVMELAGRVFDVITHPENFDAVRKLLPELTAPGGKEYWRRVVRMAALCHDMGHLPFSHAAENELLPHGWDHESLSRLLIESDEMKKIWEEVVPPIRADHVVKLALGVRKAKDLTFSKLETVLSEIIVGDAFGVDRIDYLLRDSHHTGVAYGKFDHYRLIDELRILPTVENSNEVSLGIASGGIYSAEALALARYFMFSQVYYHPIRLIYDIHLKDFLGAWLQPSLIEKGTFPVDVEGHLGITDEEVNVAMRVAAGDRGKPGHEPAKCIMHHKHFKVLYVRNPKHVKLINTDPAAAVFAAAEKEFGAEIIRYSKPKIKNATADFPVSDREGAIHSAVSVSETLSRLQPSAIDYVFVHPEYEEKAHGWLNKNINVILSSAASSEKED
jgi:HD superfamily phosphohydrolase